MWAVPSGLFAYIANKFFGIPYIIWVLGSDIWIYGRKKFTKFILRGILKNSLKLYADGEELRGETELISGKLCEFLPSSRILPQDNLPEITLNNNKINFLFIGRYHPHKGVDILIDAIHLLPKEISDRCHFHLYGGGQLEKFIKNKIREYELNNVSIKGYVDMYELSALMRTAHFLIIPSRKDSIPVVFSDALQCGLPMIVSRVGDMGKLVEKYGIGFSFEKENQTELSQLIIKVISLKKEFFCDNIQKARRFFDVRKACITIINDINAAP
jgi:glycosyltransferase involved in cell wall biosynthesis